MNRKPRFNHLLMLAWTLLLVLSTLAIAQPSGLPESSATWLSDWQAEPKAEAVDRKALRAAETRVFEFIERGTGDLIAVPYTAAEQAAVGRHLALLAEVLAEPDVIRHPDGSVSMNHGLRFASGQVPVQGPDGKITLRCTSVREHLLGRSDPGRFPGFLTREAQR
jgi:hypothetical protein